MKPSCHSLLLLANKKLEFQKNTTEGHSCGESYPCCTEMNGRARASVSISSATAGEQPAAGRLNATQTPDRRRGGSLPFLFSPLVHMPFPCRWGFQRHLEKQREAAISVPADSILFPAPAGPNHINGCKVNSGPGMGSVFLSQPLGAVALQLLNYYTFPSGFELPKQGTDPNSQKPS